MVDRIELNGMLMHALQRKDFTQRLLSQNNSTREKALGEFELDLTGQERTDLLSHKAKSLKEFAEFCRDRFELNKPRVG